jgi:NADH-quinone oxidoreductase subunit J
MSGIALGTVGQWIAFAVFALIALAGALGMATTMSMFRSGIFLMASFMGVAGLFILLLADLLGLLQIMMYIGGMLVMILFMVLFAHDPGGDMMAGMKMSPIEDFFSLGLLPRKEEGQGGESEGTGGQGMDMAMDMGDMEMGTSEQGARDMGDMDMDDMAGMDNHEMGGMDMGGMDMAMDMGDMSMTTPIKRPAAVAGVAIGALLVAMLLLRPAWPVVSATPDPHSAEQVGTLLMGKYMMAFEGAGLLILVGIFGAVLMSRSRRSPDESGREVYVAVDEPPPAVDDAPLEPLAAEGEELAAEDLAQAFRDEEE